ncbi:Uncharacterised protein [Segatella copri]|nr:Uncharacterised protein [Segatella copri]
MIAYYHSAACKNHQQRDAGCAESALHLKQRRDITEPAEDAAIAQEGGGDDEPRSLVAEEMKLCLHTVVWQCFYIRNPSANHV